MKHYGDIISSEKPKRNPTGCTDTKEAITKPKDIYMSFSLRVCIGAVKWEIPKL